MFRFLLLLLLVGWLAACGSNEAAMTNTQSEAAATSASADDEHDKDDHDHDEEHDDHDDEHHDEDGEERREHGAHEHGAAEMNIAWTGGDVIIELLTPAFNVLGFEYAPSTESEIALVDESVGVLEAAAFLQFSTAADCVLVSAEVHTEFAEDEHKEDEHKDDEHAGEEEEADTHSDIEAEYTFACDRPERLAELNLSGLFAQFPNFEDLRVQWVSDAQQSAATVSADSPVISFE